MSLSKIAQRWIVVGSVAGAGAALALASVTPAVAAQSVHSDKVVVTEAPTEAVVAGPATGTPATAGITTQPTTGTR